MTDTMPDVATYRQEARAWLEANLEPRDPSEGLSLRGVGAHRSAEEFALERALQRRVFDAGYSGITWPKEYGGQGLSPQHARAFKDEANNFRMPDLGAAGATVDGPSGQTILAHASPEFLKRHGPKMLAGEELFAQLFSEPGAGSDLGGITTRAVKDGEHWVLTGSKIWSSGAADADYGMCLARTDWEATKHRGLTWFAVPLDAKGVTVEPIKEINGSSDFCQEFLDEVEVPDEDVIGEVNEGWAVAQTMLLYERGSGSDDPRLLPGVERGVDGHVVEMATRSGKIKDPAARQLIARIHTMDWLKVQLSKRVAGLMRTSDRPPASIASYWKLASGVFDPVRAQMVTELAGGGALGWHEGDEPGRLLSINHLNSRVWSIAGGSNEIQRNSIGERALGLPREPSFDTNKPFSEVVRAAQNWTGKPS